MNLCEKAGINQDKSQKVFKKTWENEGKVFKNGKSIKKCEKVWKRMKESFINLENVKINIINGEKWRNN